MQLPPAAATQVSPQQIACLKVTQTTDIDGYWLPITALVKGDKPNGQGGGPDRRLRNERSIVSQGETGDANASRTTSDASASRASLRGLWSSYAVVTEDSQHFQAERRYLELLETQGDRVLVRGTLQPGDEVIVDGTHRIIPGQLVKKG